MTMYTTESESSHASHLRTSPNCHASLAAAERLPPKQRPRRKYACDLRARPSSTEAAIRLVVSQLTVFHQLSTAAANFLNCLCLTIF